jgi:hypothetical protein
VVPDVEGFHALALQRPIKPPLTEKEIGAKEKDVKRLRDSMTLVADSHGHFLVEPIIKRHTSLVPIASQYAATSRRVGIREKPRIQFHL